MLKSLVGASAPMRQLRDTIARVARFDANVLITGDTGTGKERVAECIHAGGSRADQPFVCVNCAAIPDALFESELFGYEKGAFTGANHDYPGKLREAASGTIFFDEIGDLSLLGQAKLLRVLENREVYPLGARRGMPIHARFVAATNHEVEPAVAERRFRQDLYYRLNVVRINLLPLRDRRADIPALFTHFVNVFNDRYHVSVGGPDAELLDCLLQYNWPGNVRELRNLVEVIFIDPPSEQIRLTDLPEHFRAVFSEYRTPTVPERDQILKVLRKTNWNKKQAAAEMNWSRMTLYRKLDKYGIESFDSEQATE